MKRIDDNSMKRIDDNSEKQTKEGAEKAGSVKRKETDLIRRIVWLLDIFFCLGCLIYSLGVSVWHVIACAATVVLVSLPLLFERLFKIRLSLGFFVCCSLYALGPMIGEVFRLYYVTSWWDELLHLIGGIVFARIGLILLGFLNRKSTTALCVVFALCFSMAVSVVWEICEYGMDSIAGTDAQQDEIVTSIHSYRLGGEAGLVGDIDPVESTVINGPNGTRIDGYLDIGLHDTMGDLLFETLGAVAFAGHFLYRERRKTKRAAANKSR